MQCIRECTECEVGNVQTALQTTECSLSVSLSDIYQKNEKMMWFSIQVNKVIALDFCIICVVIF